MTSDVNSPATARTRDQLFHQLAHPMRRRILAALLVAGPDAVLGYEDLHAGESDDQPLQLVHSHLPSLAAAGYVEWDREAEAVTVGPAFDSVAPTLDLLRGDGRLR